MTRNENYDRKFLNVRIKKKKELHVMTVKNRLSY